MKSRLILTAAALIAASAAGLQARNLVLLHTNDTHSQIDPGADGLGGVERRKAVIDSVRAANDDVLLIDAGDIVQGTLFFNIYKGELEEKLMNALGYDMRILGNHEFDNGIDALARNLQGAESTLLAANYQMRGTPLEGLFQPYKIYEYDGRRIAFMPVNLNPSGMIADGNYTGMGYVDAIEAANNMAWYLKHIIQADAVVAITHIGYELADQPNDVELVKSSRDIDMVIGGHSHTTVNPADPMSEPWLVKNADGRDILVAQTGRYGKNIGQITIDLDNLQATPDYKLIAIDSRLDDRLDPAIAEIIAPYRAEVDALNSRPVAKTAKTLDKDGPEILNFAADFVDHRGRQIAEDVDFAIINKGSIRNTLKKGDITEGQVITLIPFFNRIEVIDVKGHDLIEAFDVMAQANGNGVSSQVEAVYDVDSHKCTAITINGKPVDPDRTYRIATNDYLANGGDYMTPLKRHKLVAVSDRFLYEDLLDYLHTAYKGKKINPSPTMRMRPGK